MSPNFAIAFRFIVSRKRSMFMSLAGIVFGVGFFIVTQAQTSGFEQFYIDTIVGADSPIRIEDRFQHIDLSIQAADKDGKQSGFIAETDPSRKFIRGIEYPDKLRIAVEEFSDVTAVSEVLKGEARAISKSSEQIARVLGIRVKDHLQVTDLDRQMLWGSLDDFSFNPSAVLLGRKFAERMHVEVGDYILFEYAGDTRRYKVAGIFETGIEQIDKQRVFMHIGETRALFKKPFGEAIFQIGVRDPNQADRVAERLEETLQHNVIPWQEREKSWLQVFNVLRISSAITVSTIILISGLGMFNTLAMLVMEKTREIAILRSIGYTRQDISRIFLWQGFLVLIAGTICGWAFGAFVTFAISKLPIKIRGIFTADSFIVNWDINHYLWAAVVAAITVMIASYIPARRAAALEPGSIIRGTSM
ncbi:ABC transporter permease [Cerasicoccus fimbriatus]|uniref:ABC transporter permease n=1 Tax=Cerasicoccus fimbriatus TaxID=3014554 RepID=UPI0022B3886F|nr:FtsX-like permease family protein [Cerasicoccus sp. TK19100]